MGPRLYIFLHPTQPTGLYSVATCIGRVTLDQTVLSLNPMWFALACNLTVVPMLPSPQF